MNAFKVLFFSLIFISHFAHSESNESIDLDTAFSTEEYLSEDPFTETSFKDTYSVDEILEKLEEELAHFVTFAFCDITGNLKEIVLPLKQAENVLKNGLSIAENNVLIKPDLKSLRFLPWTTGIHRTAWFMCTAHKNSAELREEDRRSIDPRSIDPRSILAQLHKQATNLGYNFKVGIELDFLLLEKNEHGLLVPSDQASYLDPEYNLSKQQEINLLLHALRDFNIDIEKIEHGISHGQWRITLQSADVLKMADNVIACKYALKVLTQQLRQHITFMPKPFQDKNGNKIKIKYTLFDIENNKNAFYDKIEQFKLSAIAKKFLAGNLNKAIELSAFFMPTVNSYKNIPHILQAYNCWSPQNYNTMFNSILCDQDERAEELYLQCKIADCTCNIYLVLGALLKSGLQGMKKAKNLNSPLLEIPAHNALSQELIASLNINLWPTNLSEALNLFEKSLFAKKLMSEKGHSKYLELKRNEWNEYNSFISEWEKKKYL